MSNMREFMKLFELGPEAPTTTYRDLDGRQMNNNISYAVAPTKVIATLQSYNSATYTKLAQKIIKVTELEAEIKTLKEDIKAEGRSSVADLFAADDATKTRVVETVSFIFTLTKDPAPTKTTAYAKVLEELTTHLTPELVTVLEAIKLRYQTEVQKPAALSVKPLATEGINEGPLDAFKSILAKFRNAIERWCSGYDKKLDALKAQVGIMESNVDNSSQIKIFDDLTDWEKFIGEKYPDTQFDEEYDDRLGEWKVEVKFEGRTVAKFVKFGDPAKWTNNLGSGSVI